MRLSSRVPESGTGDSRPGLARARGDPTEGAIPIRRLILAALVAAFCISGPAYGWQRGERTAARHCERGNVVSCIHRAALHRHVSFSWLRSTAWCESRYNPSAVNGQYVGLFQFGANAWSRAHYAEHSPWSAKWASLGAAYMFSIGHSSEWECA